MKMSEEYIPLEIINEPALEFRYGQRLHDPHNGLSLFGPVDVDAPEHKENILYGIIGAPEGVEAFKFWAKLLNKSILPKDGDGKKQDRRIWPPFPGFEAVFSCKLPEEPGWESIIDREELLEKANHMDPNTRTYGVVESYLNEIKTIKKKDESFDVILCVVPDEVWLNCRPKSRVSDGEGYKLPSRDRKLYKEGQTSINPEFDTRQFHFSVDFRRQIKARCMQYGIPIQIIRESTLSIDSEMQSAHRRGLTFLSDRAWNLCTTLYYKAGGKPWKLAGAREGVCYIGISFKRTRESNKSRTACCAAQMFLDSGDGVVFLGEYGPWYSPRDKQYHLPKEAAYKLLKGVLETYRELRGKNLKEVFLHSRSYINSEEFEGYKEACPNDVGLVGIRVRQDKGFKLFREGTRPVIRGTFYRLNEKTGFLWASGFIPQIGTYAGWEVPNPLRIDIQHGEGDIEQVTKDIFALTKLNYNACRIGDSEPVTIKFSDAVGEILVSNRKIPQINPNFKFYI